MSSDHEVLGGMDDYYYAAQEKKRKKSVDEPRFLGRLALALFKKDTVNTVKQAAYDLAAIWKQSRAEKKAIREGTEVPAPYEGRHRHEYQGRHRFEDQQLPINAVDASNHINDGMAEVMGEAVSRARQRLGELPVLEVMGQQSDTQIPIPKQPEQGVSSIPDISTLSDEDRAVVKRLNAAYNQPGIRHEDRNTAAGQHRAHDDDLTVTVGK